MNSKRKIDFRDDIVRQKIDAFDFDRGKQLVSIGAWVLMPNHFHIYVMPKIEIPRKSDFRNKNEENNVSIFMRKLCTSYSKYFNSKYIRSGGLFESNFKSTYVGSDSQAKYLFSYIHLNPVKLFDHNWKKNGVKNVGKTRSFLNKYKWSSYLDFLGKERIESKIISLDDFPKYFKDKAAIEKEIFDWFATTAEVGLPQGLSQNIAG
jgi:putative transposase